MVAGLDASLFAKVRAVHDRTDNPGEKAAAAGRMEALARAAGMTVKQATSKVDTPAPKAAPDPSFADFFDTPFFRQAKEDGDRRRTERWREVLAEYGSEDAVFSPSAWEIALEQACEPFVVRKVTTGWRIGSLLGWDFVTSRGDPAPQIVDAIATAYPMPTTVQSAWAEFAFWNKLGSDREARGVGCGDHRDWVYFRVQLVERMLDKHPAAGLADLRARMDHMDWRNDLESAPDPAEERIRLATIRADIERMGAKLREQDTAGVQTGRAAWDGETPPHPQPSDLRTEPPVQSGQGQGDGETPPPLTPPDLGETPTPVQNGHLRRTNAQKRATVALLLGQGLADREIARRAGVSPQTVGNIRKAKA